MVLTDDCLSVTATEPRDPLETSHSVERYYQEREVHPPHLVPHHGQLEAGVDPVRRHGVVWAAVGDIPSSSYNDHDNLSWDCSLPDALQADISGVVESTASETGDEKQEVEDGMFLE